MAEENVEQVERQEPTPEDLESESTQADVGVLLVHGIGHRGSSDTLVRFGEPLIDWIKQWVGVVTTGNVEVDDAVLGVEAEDPSTPAHVRLSVSAPRSDGQGLQTSKWLVAESWWSQSFVTPSFLEVANWGLKIVPWTVFIHYQRRFERAWSATKAAWRAKPRNWRAIASKTATGFLELFWQLLAVLLAPILLAAISLVLVIGVIPIPVVRRIVGSLQRGVALTVGDSYALLGPNIAAGAIYGRVSRELEWLSARAKRVAVIAHSQGAAIAYKAVTRDRSKKCRLLVTFGAGIRKLTHIRRLEGIPQVWVRSVALALITFVIALFISRARLGIGRGILVGTLAPVAWLAASFVFGAVWGFIRKIQRRVSNSRTRDLPSLAEGVPSSVANAIGFLGIIVGVVAIAWWMPGPSRADTIWVTSLMTLAWALVIGSFVKARTEFAGISSIELPETGRPNLPEEKPLPKDVEWVDIYASNDPVPNGAIFDGIKIDPLERRHKIDGGEDTKSFTTIEVGNRGSILADHSSYWQNREGFVAAVVSALGHLSGLNLEEVLPFDRERLILASHRRQWRLDWLRRARLVVFVSAVAVWLSGTAAEYGESLSETTVDWITKIIPVLESFVSIQSADGDVGEFAIVLLGAIVAFSLVRGAWAYWDTKDLRELVTRGDYVVSHGRIYPATLLHAVWLLIFALATTLIIGQAWPWWVYVIGVVILFLGSGALAGGTDSLRGLSGGLVYTWPLLLKGLGCWDEVAEKRWEERVKTNKQAVVYPQEIGGSTRWSVYTTLTHRSNPVVYERTGELPSLEAAVEWSKQHVLPDRIFTPSPRGDLIPVALALQIQSAAETVTSKLEKNVNKDAEESMAKKRKAAKKTAKRAKKRMKATKKKTAKKAKKRVRRTNPRAIDTVPLPEKPARRKKKSKKTKRKARKKK